jgi:hypothetical protein
MASLNGPLPLYVPTVLAWFSSSAPPEKTKRITLQRKDYAKDARIARYPAPGESAAYLALPLLWFNVLQVRLLTRLVKTLGRQAEQGSEFRRIEAIECAQELGVKIPML